MLTKTTPPEIKALYDECMDLFATTQHMGVFADHITIVFDRQPDTDRHDVWFYCYKEGPDRIATITAGGTQLCVDSDTTANRVLYSLKSLPSFIVHERNRICELETGVPYLVATGQAVLPATPHRKPTRERRH